LPHTEHAPVEVHILPAKAERFALPKAEGCSDVDDGAEAMVADRLDQGARVIRRQRIRVVPVPSCWSCPHCQVLCSSTVEVAFHGDFSAPIK